MASNEIKVGVNVSDNGTAAKTEKQVDKLQKKLEQAQKTANKVNVGGTAGSRAASQKASQLDNTGYRQASGSMGKTGASARDFAREAQGLGGLVRLYATYAANIFAVTAAFGALSRAMDTTNMIRGLDALGAASGQNLGQLSKRLVDATDGAISLQEAMKAVAQTSSAGMSSENIERLAKVAKSASLALGVSMPDAMSRLSRGVTKLEPELLDELGIMTKLDPAVQKYARQVGKSASQLTDFERRQAFANAVLEEGEKKFSALAEAAANPYDKLLASLKNVVQSGLEVVNKVLGPLVDLLSQNPTILTTALAGVGIILAKQAMPALGEFKRGLQEAAKESEALYKSKVADAEAAKTAIEKLHKTQMDQIAAQKVDEVDAAASKLGNLRKTSAAYKALQMDLDDLTEKEFKAIELQAKRTKDPQRAQDIRDLGTALKGASTAQADFFATIKDTATYTNTLAVAEKARINNIKQGLITQAAQNASVAGMGGAMVLLRANIDTADISLTKFQRTVLLARGGFAALGGQIAAFGNKINAALGWIGMLFTVVGLLDSALSSNSKALSNFTSDLDAASSSAEAASRTMEFLSKQEIITEYSISNVKALATAFNELSTRAEKVAKDAKAAKAAMSGWDKFKDFFYGFFNADLDTKIAATLSEQITSGLDLVKGTGVGEKAQETFTELLGGSIDPTNLEAVREKLKGLSDDARQKVVAALQELNVVIGDSNLRLQGFSTALDATKTAFQDFITSTANNDPLYKLGNSLGTLAESMEKLKTGGINEIQSAFLDLRNSTQVLASLGPSFAKSFANVGQQFETNAANITKFNEQLANSKKEYEELEKAYNKRLSTKGLGSVRPEDRPDLVANITSKDATARNLKAQMDAAKNTADIIEANMVDAQTKAAEAGAKLYGEVLTAANAKSAEYLATATGNATKAAQAIIDQAKLSGLTGEQRAREQNRLAEQQIQLDINAIQISIDLIKSQANLKASIDAATAQRTLDTAGDKATDAEKRTAEITKAIAMVLGSKDGITAALKTVPKDIAEEVRYGISSTQAALGGQNAALKIAGGKQTAQMRTGEMNIRAGRREDAAAVRQLEEQINAAIEKRNDLTKALTGNYDLIAVKADQIAAKEELIKKQKAEEDAYLDRILDATGNYAQEEKVRGELELAQKRQKIELENLTLEQRIQIANIDKEIAMRDLTYLQQKEAIVYKMSQDQQTVSTQLLELELQKMQALGIYTQSYMAEKAYEMEVYTVTEDAKKAKSDALFEYQKQQALDLVNYEAAVKAGGADSSEAERISTTMALRATELEARLSGIDAVKAKQLELKDAIKATTDEEAKFAKSMNALKGLDKIFAGLGTSISGAAEAMRKYTKDSEKNSKTVSKAQATYSSELKKSKPNVDQLAKSSTELQKAQQEQAESELDNVANVAGATKSMFAEKTAAYKVLSAIEQAVHIARIAMMVKEMFFDTAATASAVANSGTRTAADVAESGVKGVKAIVNTLANLPPPVNFIAGAAMAAIVASLLSKIGGSSPGAISASGPTVDQKNEVSGTGYAYDAQGKKYDTGYGALGDPGKKLTSISDGISLMTDLQKESLVYDDRLLKSFNAVAEAITGVSIAVYGTPSLQKGLSFDSASYEGLGSMFKDIPLIGGVLGGIGNFLYSSSSSKSVKDFGVKLTGSIDALTSATTASVKAYQDSIVSWKEKVLGFTVDSGSKPVREYGTVEASLVSAISEVFTGIKTMTYDLANAAGIAQSKVTSALASIDAGFELSTKGKTGEEIAKEFEGNISLVLSKLGKTIFGAFEKYAQTGETLFDTTLRVVESQKAIKEAFDYMGVSMDVTKGYVDSLKLSFSIFGAKVSATIPVFRDGFYITEELAKLAGGLDNFLEQARYFNDNFIPEADRIEILSSKVNTKLRELGVGFLDSKEAVADYVRALDFTVPANRELYQELMNLAPAMREVFEASAAYKENILSMQDVLKQSGSDMNILDDNYRKVNHTFHIFGRTIRWSSRVLVKSAEDIQQSLIDAAGSVDNFISQTEQFTSQFITSEQQLNMSQKVVTDSLSKLGLSYIKNREQLTSYIQGLDLAYDSSVASRQALMNILDDLDTVFSKQEAVAEERKGLELREAELMGETAKLRQAELDKLDSTNQDLQKRIWLLEEEKAIADQAKSLQATLNQELGNTNILREQELEALYEVNRVIQEQVYVVQDYKKALSDVGAAESKIEAIRNKATNAYITAENAVIAQQEKIADLAVQAAKKMRDFGQSLRDFISSTILGDKKQSATVTFTDTVSKALAGDTSAIGNITKVAKDAIDYARSTSSNIEEFNKKQASILTEVGRVASYTEKQAALTNIPADEDPAVAANNKLAELLLAQKTAKDVAETIGASLVASIEDLKTDYLDAVKELSDALLDKQEAQLAAAALQLSLDNIEDNTKSTVDGTTDIIKALYDAMIGGDESLSKLIGNQYDKLDTNVDGLLTFDELKQGLGGIATDEQLAALFATLDDNENGRLDKAEVDRKAAQTDLLTVLETSFSTLGTEVLTFDQIKLALEGKASDTYLDSILKQLDINNDGVIDQSEAFASTVDGLDDSLKGYLQDLGTGIGTKVLTFDQIKLALEGKASDAYLDSILKQLDINNDGVIDQSEAFAATVDGLNDNLKSYLQDTANAVVTKLTDVDGSIKGSLTKEQFSTVLEEYGISTKKEQDALFDWFDQDKDGLVSASETTARVSGTSATDTANIVGNGNYQALLLANIEAAIVSGFSTQSTDTNYYLEKVADSTSTTAARTLDLVTALNAVITNTAATATNTGVLAEGFKAGSSNKGNANLVTATSAVASGKSKSLGSYISDLAGGVIDAAGNILKSVGNVISGAVKGVGDFISGIFSDVRTKQNIKYHSTYSGINLYDFDYKNQYKSEMGYGAKRGVIAQEVAEEYPGAVMVDPKTGFMKVNYSKLPIPRSMLKFADGGAFTNGIVKDPTVFNAALMGEAGPEAVMPLSQTRDGKLGVIATAAKPSVEAPSSTANTDPNKALLEEIRALKEEVNLLRYEARATATSTSKTSKILERVTLNGDSLLVTNTSTL